MKKMIPIIIVGVLILSGIRAIATTDLIEDEKCDVLTDDELDQYQMIYDYYMPVGKHIGILGPPPLLNFSIAQSFTPTKEILTRVKLFVSKNIDASHPYVVAIRDDLYGENLAVASVDPSEFDVLPDFTWIEFDFDDTPVTIGQTYYIISYTADVIDNFYGWGFNPSDLYPNGTMLISTDDGETWYDSSGDDTCFKTYGKDDESPSVEIVNPTEGYFHFSGIKLFQTRLDIISDTIGFGGFRLRPIQVTAEDDLDDSDDLIVKIYIDGDEKGTATWNEENEYYEWKWTGLGLGTYMLNVTAEDSRGNIGNDEMEVWYFCFFPSVEL